MYRAIIILAVSAVIWALHMVGFAGIAWAEESLSGKLFGDGESGWDFVGRGIYVLYSITISILAMGAMVSKWLSPVFAPNLVKATDVCNRLNASKPPAMSEAILASMILLSTTLRIAICFFPTTMWAIYL